MKRLPILIVSAVALTSCGQESTVDTPEVVEDAAELEIVSGRVEITTVDGFHDVGSSIVDIALLPMSPPYQSRAILAVEAGGFLLADLNEVVFEPLAGPRVTSVDAAPGFQMRGVPTPLVFAAGGELETPAAFIYLVEVAQLVPVPMEPIAPELGASSLCIEREEAGIIILVVSGDAGTERWRVRDAGGDLLAAERVDPLDAGPAALVCAQAQAQVTDGDFEDISDAAAVDGYVLAASASRGLVDAASNDAAPRQIAVVAGMNSPAAEHPARIAASPENFGGSFGLGVVLVSDGPSLSILAFDVVTSALDQSREPS